jgi:hypothetical protein
MKTPDARLAQLTPELALELFDLPISFHRSYVRVTGSVTAALMLSQAIAWSEALEPQAQGWFSKSQADWACESGLTRWEQQTARRVLRKRGLLEERKAGAPARLWFRVNEERLWQVLREPPQPGAEHSA